MLGFARNWTSRRINRSLWRYIQRALRNVLHPSETIWVRLCRALLNAVNAQADAIIRRCRPRLVSGQDSLNVQPSRKAGEYTNGSCRVLRGLRFPRYKTRRRYAPMPVKPEISTGHCITYSPGGCRLKLQTGLITRGSHQPNKHCPRTGQG